MRLIGFIQVKQSFLLIKLCKDVISTEIKYLQCFTRDIPPDSHFPTPRNDK